MDPKVREYLVEYFLPHKARLYEFLGRDLAGINSVCCFSAARRSLLPTLTYQRHCWRGRVRGRQCPKTSIQKLCNLRKLYAPISFATGRAWRMKSAASSGEKIPVLISR